MKYIANNMKGKMKNAITAKLGLIACCLVFFSLSSCEKMIETGSDRQNFNPELNAKTDSVFYTFGIAQAMQQLADQYFFQGEMRGELVATTEYTDNNLRQLANFSADITNMYDSAFVYYRVINNCNYYLAHRDTTLLTGATPVTRNETAAVKAYRAWAYLQLARNYGKVPFFTEPLTTISQIDDNRFPEYGLEEIASVLCPELEASAGFSVPNYGSEVPCGSTNYGVSKSINTSRCFIPIGVILGDLYLETGQYDKAIQSYINYLTAKQVLLPRVIAPFKLRNPDDKKPSDMEETLNSNPSYQDIFKNNNVTDIVSYIPMSVSRVRGTVTNVPSAFGYDYYALSSSACWNERRQLIPSEAYNALAASQDYYYYKKVPVGGIPNRDKAAGNYGDMRSLAIMNTNSVSGRTTNNEEEEISWINKYQSGNIILYRAATVYLHLCEALNRKGLPDVAFAFLKEGINSNDTIKENTWLSPAGKQFFRSTFLNEKNAPIFSNSQPIHQRGSGVTSDGNYPGTSPYKYDTEIMRKAQQLAATPNLCPTGFANRLTNSANYNAALAAYDPTDETATPIERSTFEPLLDKQDTIFVMEELLCDEEALEFCFEGTRWYDLMRFAKHKNRAGLQGNLWLAEKLKGNQPVKALTSESNWYLPFKK